jgi:predicted nucleic acid-binding protein
MTTYLFDTNIWLRLVQPQAPQHPRALHALTMLLAQGDAVVVTPQNLIEFWSVATRPIEANGLGWTIEMTQQEIERILTQFPLLDDIPAIFAAWLRLVTTYRVTGRRVHDARLAAAMQAHGVTHLLTFNGDDFRQFTEIVIVEPPDVPPPQ